MLDLYLLFSINGENEEINMLNDYFIVKMSGRRNFF